MCSALLRVTPTAATARKHEAGRSEGIPQLLGGCSLVRGRNSAFQSQSLHFTSVTW